MNIKRTVKARNISEVLEELSKNSGKTKLIAGGTDVLVHLRNGKFNPEVLVDISSIEEIKKIEEVDGYIEIGAGVTFTELVKSSRLDGNLKGLIQACHSVGSPQIRNKGTIGGNIANSSSAADSIPPLLCLDTTLVFESLGGAREVSLEDFYLDKEKSGLRDDELLTKIRFKKLNKNTRLSFSKIGLRKALAISRLSNSILLELEEGKVKHIAIGSGALGRYPLRERQIEDFLVGKKLTDENIDEALKLLKIELEKRLGGRSTFPYKKVAIESTFIEAMKEVIEC